MSFDGTHWVTSQGAQLDVDTERTAQKFAKGHDDLGVNILSINSNKKLLGLTANECRSQTCEVFSL